MGALNLSQYQTRVRLLLNNMPATDPYITAGFDTQAINDGANDLIAFYPELFPEHHDRSWTVGPTTIGKNVEALARNVIYITDVRSADDQAISDPANADSWNGITEHLVVAKTPEFIGRLAKGATATGYPRLYARKGNQLLFWPTVRTGFSTYLRIYGVSGEIRISAPGATFHLSENYDHAVCVRAAARLAMVLGRGKRAKELDDELSSVMGGPHVRERARVDPRARERAQRTVTFTSAMAPTQ